MLVESEPVKISACPLHAFMWLGTALLVIVLRPNISSSRMTNLPGVA